MPMIDTLELRVTEPDAQRQFYCEMLGMRELGEQRVGYGGEQASIRFLRSHSAYDPGPEDLYWKIALAVPNIELAYEQLRAKGISVSAPSQFQNVGYLAHLNDPQGMTIELIEHFFEGSRPATPATSALLGGGASLNLITLRTADIAPVEKMLTAWGMVPLSVQPVDSHGFTLYFYAFTTDAPPSADLQAIENRTWVYQRPYTVLEIQHLHHSVQIAHPSSTATGYAGIRLAPASGSIQSDVLLVSSR